MISGAETIGEDRRVEPEWAPPESSLSDTDVPDSVYEEAEPEQLPRSTATRILAVLLTLLALGWIGFSGYALTLAWPGPSLPAWAGWAASTSTPLILLALLWLAFGRSSRREAARFIAAVGEMKRETRALEGTLAVVATRLEENRSALAGEATRLMSLGDEASDRLGRVTHYLARESAELERKAGALDAAAAAARVDIGALMSDLPRAEEQARAAAAALKDAGLSAHEQAAALEGQVAALTARSREADENLGGAAQRLGAQISRIETSTSAAAARIDEAATQMNAAVDGAMSRASESVDQARAGLDAQGQAMLAMVEQSRTAFATAGAEAARMLLSQLEEAGARIETLAGQLTRQEAASRELVTGIATAIGDLETRLSGLGETGDAQNQRLSQSVAALRESAEALQRELFQGESASSALAAQAGELDRTLDALAGRLRDDLPGALGEVQAQVLQTGAAASAAMGSIEAIRDAAAQAATSLAQGEASIQTQRGHLDALLETVERGTRDAEEQLRALGSAAQDSHGAAERIVQESAPQLIDALLRVRETAQQAASHAREAIAAVIPESAATLAEASREAVLAAITEPVEDQLTELGAAAQRAMAVARQASERLTRQLLAMSETASAIEDRIAVDRVEREEKDAENLSRRVSLLIEALNSTAIDVGKILSNEVSDTAWAAYLKGDRGVFTRRAVRLLETGEAREIARHYEEEPEFREQVNRYVHDFEAILRRVLADRDGGTLSVTLLSSDMGKLYVALAQAIDRLRR